MTEESATDQCDSADCDRCAAELLPAKWLFRKQPISKIIPKTGMVA